MKFQHESDSIIAIPRSPSIILDIKLKTFVACINNYFTFYKARIPSAILPARCAAAAADVRRIARTKVAKLPAGYRDRLPADAATAAAADYAAKPWWE